MKGCGLSAFECAKGSCGASSMGSSVCSIPVQAETIAAASSGPDDVQYEDVPYVLVYATVSPLILNLCKVSDYHSVPLRLSMTATLHSANAFMFQVNHDLNRLFAHQIVMR